MCALACADLLQGARMDPAAEPPPPARHCPPKFVLMLLLPLLPSPSSRLQSGSRNWRKKNIYRSQHSLLHNYFVSESISTRKWKKLRFRIQILFRKKICQFVFLRIENQFFGVAQSNCFSPSAWKLQFDSIDWNLWVEHQTSVNLKKLIQRKYFLDRETTKSFSEEPLLEAFVKIVDDKEKSNFR